MRYNRPTHGVQEQEAASLRGVRRPRLEDSRVVGPGPLSPLLGQRRLELQHGRLGAELSNSALAGAGPPFWQATGAAAARALGLLGGLALLGALGGTAGRAMIRRFGLWGGPATERWPLALALGWGLFGLALLGLGLLGLWRTGVLAFAAAAIALACALESRRPVPFLEPAPAPPWTAWEKVAAGGLAALALFNFFGALMPEIFYDALVYHLALPAVYWKHGGIVPTADNLYSGLPLLVQMLYGAALPLGGDALARLLNWSFGVLTAGLCVSFGARHAPAGRAFWRAPILLDAAGGRHVLKCGVEPGWAFFQLAAIAAFARRVSDPEGPATWTVLAGVLTGLAMGPSTRPGPRAYSGSGPGLDFSWNLPGKNPRRRFFLDRGPGGGPLGFQERHPLRQSALSVLPRALGGGRRRAGWPSSRTPRRATPSGS